MRELTVWIDPLDAPQSLDAACNIAITMANSISSQTRRYHPNLLLPTHYGQWPQAECNQNLPPDLLVNDDPSVIKIIRTIVEGKGIGFGVWGVPLNQNSAILAATHAREAGFYVANFEPGNSFWKPGDNPAAIDAWWTAFWNELGEETELDGNVAVTVIPNEWGLVSFENSVSNLEGGANVVLLETYGGPATPEYHYPNSWPTNSVVLTREYQYNKPLACILSNLNLTSQWKEVQRLCDGNIHVWYAR
jgi:hypothetical protein